MIREHDRVVLLESLPEMSLRKGDIGMVVHVHGGGKSFEVEFLTLGGETIGIATLTSKQVRAARRREVAHARSISAT